MGGRMSGMSSPLENIVRRIHGTLSARIRARSKIPAATAGPIYLKSLMLIGYIAGIIGRCS